MYKPLLALLPTALLLFYGCAQPPPQDPEAFLRQFIAALASGRQSALLRYYPQDRDLAFPEGAGARAAGAGRETFLRSCAGARQCFGGAEPQITALSLSRCQWAEDSAGALALNASDSYRGVSISLEAGGREYCLIIDEMVRLPDGWRILAFHVERDLGTERLPDQVITPATEQPEPEEP